MPPLRSSFLLLPSAWLALGLVSACSGPKNEEERARSVPAVTFATETERTCVLRCLWEPIPSERVVTGETPEERRCLKFCTEQPTAAPVDCAAAEAGLELLPLWQFVSVAEFLYVYDDKSTKFREPSKTWEPEAVPIQRCLSGEANSAFHLYGGPFLTWGGGMGAQIADFNTVSAPGTEFPDHTRDLRGWEGVAFWARRGPNGQAGIRIAVGDKYTDDDISYVQATDYNVPPEQRYCIQYKECGCRTKPCTYNYDHKKHFCYEPGVDPEPGPTASYDTCGETKCNEAYEAIDAADVPDRQFGGKPCTPHAFRGSIVGEFCYDPAVDLPPPENSRLCGDHWTKAVQLSTEWQFFKVPFTELLQQGWAQETHFLDLSALSVIRFTWDRGWIDYWIDDVSFYRRVPPNP